MYQALPITDGQHSFDPSQWLVDGIEQMIVCLISVPTVERHDNSMTLFEKLLGWHPFSDDNSLIPADRVFIKH
jgi:hypothetical protein